MKIETKSTFGNFAILAEADVTPEQRDALANLGFLQLIQRSPASAAEKAMAGYEKRPEGFKRNSIPFSTENVDKLTAALQKPIAIGEGIADLSAAVVVTEYVPTVAAPVYAEEKVIRARHEKVGDLAEWASETVGYAGDTAETNIEFLAAIKAYKLEMLKNA